MYAPGCVINAGEINVFPAELKDRDGAFATLQGGSLYDTLSRIYEEADRHSISPAA